MTTREIEAEIERLRAMLRRPAPDGPPPTPPWQERRQRAALVVVAGGVFLAALAWFTSGPVATVCWAGAFSWTAGGLWIAR